MGEVSNTHSNAVTERLNVDIERSQPASGRVSFYSSYTIIIILVISVTMQSSKIFMYAYNQTTIAMSLMVHFVLAKHRTIYQAS